MVTTAEVPVHTTRASGGDGTNYSRFILYFNVVYGAQMLMEMYADGKIILWNGSSKSYSLHILGKLFHLVPRFLCINKGSVDVQTDNDWVESLLKTIHYKVGELCTETENRTKLLYHIIYIR